MVFKLLLHYYRISKSKIQALVLFCFLIPTVFSYGTTLEKRTIAIQNDLITIEKDCQLSVDEVFQLIRNQTEYTFIYGSDLFENTNTVILERGEIQINELLQLTLPSEYGAEFTDDKSILIKKNQQEKKFIQGRVLDEFDSPLPGVTVLVSKSQNENDVILQNGAITDEEGKYSLEIKEGSFLLFRSVGYTNQFFAIGSEVEQFIEVKLKESVSELNEVVVTGYQTLKRERATGSFSKISSESLDNQITTNFTDKLQGFVPGLLMHGGELKVRGTTTLNLNGDSEVSKPLYVVDGFPIYSDINNTVSPEDIESVTVLKDAAAASIWGVRASNGVIVITTKSQSQKPKKTQVNFSSFLTFQGAPDYQSMDLASTQSIVDYEYYAFKQRHRNPLWHVASNNSLVSEIYMEERRGNLTEEQAREQLNILGGYDLLDEIKRDFQRQRSQQQHNLSISGGTAASQYYFSSFYTKENSSIVGRENQKLNLNLNNTFKIGKKVNLSVSANYTRRESENQDATRGIGLHYFDMAAYQRFIDEEGNPVAVHSNYSQSLKEEREALGYLNWDYNPVVDRDFRDNSGIQNDLRLQSRVKWEIFPGINLSSSFQYEYGVSKRVRYDKEGSYRARNYFNNFTSIDPVSGELVKKFPKGGIYNENNDSYNAYNFRTQLDVNRSIGSADHQINGVFGMEVQKRASEFTGTGDIFGFNDQTLSGVDIRWDRATNFFDQDRDRPIQLATKGLRENRFVSFFSSASYTFKDRYSLSGSARIDQTNLFGVDPKYKNRPLWSVGASWQVDKEDFFSFDKIDQLKLRMTYGVNGNVDKNNGPYLKVRLINTDGNLSSIIKSPANPLLRWEKTEVFNVGLDIALFDNRVRASVESYMKVSTDLLGDLSLDPTFGFSKARVNYASMENKGIDFDLRVHAVKAGDFNIFTNFNLGYNKNEVTDFKLDDLTASTLLSGQGREVGKPLSSLYAYRWAGLSDTGQPQLYDAKNEIVVIDGKTLENQSENLSHVGQATPTVYGGGQLSVQYKDFTASAFLNYKFGHHFFRNTVDYARAFDTRFISSDLEKRWQNPGDEAHTDVPALPIKKNDPRSYKYRRSDHLVEDASQIRLQQIALSWQMPERLLKKIGLRKVSIQTQVQNLGTIWVANSKGIDPDYSFGPDRTPIYTIGTRIQF